MRQKIINIINYLLIGSIFTEAIFFTIPPFYYVKLYNFASILVFVPLAFLVKGIKFDKIFKVFLLVFFIASSMSLLNVINEDGNLLIYLKQFFGILLHSTVFYMLLEANSRNIKRLFAIYLNISFSLALVGVVQFIAYFIYRKFPFSEDYVRFLFDFSHFLPNWQMNFYHIGIRVNSFLPEAFSFCLVIFPAFFVALCEIFGRKKYFMSKFKSLIIITAFILSFSLVGFLGIFISFLVFLLNKRNKKLIFISLLIILVVVSLSVLVPEIKIKIQDFHDFLYGEKGWQNTNQSTYTLIRHALVTYDVLRDNILFGHGFGSHLKSFIDHTYKYSIKEPAAFFVLNKTDANSLLLRTLSETGLIGVILLLSFIFYNYKLIKEDKYENFWIINNSIFILLILRLVRQGNYVSEGFFFFSWLYYFSKKEINTLNRFYTPFSININNKLFKKVINYRKAILVVSFIAITLLIFVFLFNYIIDPFGFNNKFTFERINQYKMSSLVYPVNYKLNLIRKGNIDNLLIGTSTIGVMNPNTVSRYLCGKTFNLALAGSNIYEHLKLLTYALRFNKIKNIIYGIDFLSININNKYTEDYKNNIRIVEGYKNPVGVNFWIRPSTLEYSLITIFRNLKDIKFYDTFYKQNGQCIYFKNIKLAESNSLNFEEKNMISIRDSFIKGGKYNPFAISDELINDIKKIKEICNTNNINLYIYISPFYKDPLKAIYNFGLSKSFENFKSRLAEITSYYDFSDINVITQDPKYFWDSFHPREELSDLILGRIFQENNIARDFGKLVLKADNDDK